MYQKTLKRVYWEYNLTERHGRALLKLADDDLKRKILERVIKNELNVNRTEALVNDILNDLTKEEKLRSKQKYKSLINVRIYLNTFKKPFLPLKILELMQSIRK